ncbi:MAG TPA: carbamoyltransferase C-terminal domain-containing protein [Solirubrobacterales bacterium]|nr:carbamoyltransferase C-terminal domain-containing protein [Solirubrobacterales bacterium]
MLVLAVKVGHDGSVAAIEDGRLLYSLEGEKDSWRRYASAKADVVLEMAELLGAVPDVVALSGWTKPYGFGDIGAGYLGETVAVAREGRIFGKPVQFFTDSHERSHILGAIGMGPREPGELRAVLIWEGLIGSFYLVDDNWQVTKTVPVLRRPGHRWLHLWGIADPSVLEQAVHVQVEAAGKLMALAGFGDPTTGEARETAEAILTQPLGRMGRFRHLPVYNQGVEAQVTKDAAAALSDRLFEVFASAAREHIPAGLPLYIGGGCGLNCEWNARWRDLGHFSSVFVPPCPNDAGSAIGTAIDALASHGGDPHIEWDVYSGREFEHDATPDPGRWEQVAMTEAEVADALAEGRVFAWVQGRWEIGPRALGNRSLLADPADPRMKDRLNEIKQREDYRPIAPCCRLEDAPRAFRDGFHDPYMLYFKRVRTPETLGAVTHVDGTARVQTVTAATNEALYRLLTAVAQRRGTGVLCNTSLNFKGFGFINRMSDLVRYCEERGVGDMVVGDQWYRSRSAA